MKLNLQTTALSILGLGMGFISINSANAAVISNGTVKLGVDLFGQLNTEGVGLAYVPTGNESTYPDCLCEGWGVADPGTGKTGFANNSSGSGFLTSVSFVSDIDSATSVVDVDNGFLEVTHDFNPSAETDNLYQVDVTIENTSGSDISNLLYRRVMDWDVEPTAFNEYVTINTGNSSAIYFTSNNGFAGSNPLEGPSDLGSVGDFVDAGADDHGALFDFDFGLLKAGDTKKFTIFYGAAGNEVDALASLGAVGAEVYSLGQPNTADGPTLGTPNTFMFGFKGVGGDPIIDPNPKKTPEASTVLALLGMGVLGLNLKKKNLKLD